MAEQEASFEELAAALGAALKDVKAAKDVMDAAENSAVTARNAHRNTVAAAQSAHTAYQEYVSTAMSGFAQTHK